MVDLQHQISDTKFDVSTNSQTATSQFRNFPGYGRSFFPVLLLQRLANKLRQSRAAKSAGFGEDFAGVAVDEQYKRDTTDVV